MIMNIREKELFQVAASATNADYSVEEREVGVYSIVYNNKVYTNVRYAIAAIASTLIKKELEAIKD
jgi:hypothetical protein